MIIAPIGKKIKNTQIITQRSIVISENYFISVRNTLDNVYTTARTKTLYTIYLLPTAAWSYLTLQLNINIV